MILMRCGMRCAALSLLFLGVSLVQCTKDRAAAPPGPTVGATLIVAPATPDAADPSLDRVVATAADYLTRLVGVAAETERRSGLDAAGVEALARAHGAGLVLVIDAAEVAPAAVDLAALAVAGSAAVAAAAFPDGVPAGAVRAWRIAGHPFPRPHPSPTFHGRDVFAPTAAALAAGLLAPNAVGPPHDPVVRPASPPPAPIGHHLGTTIVGEDSFGNLVTNLSAWQLAAWSRGCPVVVRLPDGRALPLVHTFGAVRPGTALALVGSEDRVELPVRDGSARAVLELGRGARVEVELELRGAR